MRWGLIPFLTLLVACGEDLIGPIYRDAGIADSGVSDASTGPMQAVPQNHEVVDFSSSCGLKIGDSFVCWFPSTWTQAEIDCQCDRDDRLPPNGSCVCVGRDDAAQIHVDVCASPDPDQPC